MKSLNVAIVDYGLGNLYSVHRALEVCGVRDICISSNPAKILAADRVVLPGVGSFYNGINGLRESGLDIAIHKFVDSGRPLLGICLGMQLFATTSMEFGTHYGLDLIPGQVNAIPPDSVKDVPIKIPFIGWSSLDCPRNINWDKSVLTTLTQEHYVYLVHSFHFMPVKQANILATYQYGGHNITAAIKKNNITGVQFHPEKSGKVGLSILLNYLKHDSAYS